MSDHAERDYLERTIATVRNHRGAENCWPQWANIFADEIERCWAALAALERERDEAHTQLKAAEKWANTMEHERDWEQQVVQSELIQRAEDAERERDTLRAALKRATYIAEHLFAMVPREVWRDQGGDDCQGHYEGYYHAEKVQAEIAALAGSVRDEQAGSAPPAGGGGE